jgi:hypothetical protein
MDIKITKQECVLNDLILNEPVDMTMLELLLNSTILKPKKQINGEYSEDERVLLEKYKALIIKDEDGNASARVRYTRKKAFGRVGAVGGVGLVNMRGPIRHTLAKAVGLKDVDICNCHPELLVQLCKKQGYDIKVLEDYVKNRDAYLVKLQKITLWNGEQAHCITRDMAKTLPLRLMYLGSLQSWATDYGINLEDIPEWVIAWTDGIAEELTKIAKIVEDNNPKLVKEVEKGTHGPDWKRESAILSSFLQEYENRILEVIYKYSTSKGYIQDGVAVLCYDGIMLKDFEDFNRILKEFENEILLKTGFKLKLVEKEFDRVYALSYLQENQIRATMLDKDKIGKFDSAYISSLACYRMKKMYFELFVSKILRPDPVYVYIENDGAEGGESLCFYSQSKIEQTFCHLKSGERNSFGEPIKFMTKWLGDETCRTYNKMDFVPYNDSAPIETSIFNLFRGFSPLIYTEIDKSKEYEEQVLKPFHALGVQLCGNNPEHYLYLSQYIADIFQNPSRKNPIAFIIKGKEGTGKNVFLNGIGSTLGAHHYITSAKPQDFFGDYAEGFYHKLLVNMNECEGKSTFDYEGQIKSFITEDTITLNRKFVQPITIKNLARLIIFSNKPNPIPIDVRSRDRRYVVFNTTDHYLDKKYGSKFWLGMVNHFKTPQFRACLYNYYNTLDLSKFDARKRPITKAYLDMCKLYVPVEVLFLEHKIVNGKTQDLEDWKIYEASGMDTKYTPSDQLKRWSSGAGVKGEILYTEYVEFCKKFGYYKESSTFQKTDKSFYNKLGELELPLFKNKNGNVTHYRFEGEAVLKVMKERKWIDYDKDDVIADAVKDDEGDDFSDLFKV